jgi:hypothetical protein
MSASNVKYLLHENVVNELPEDLTPSIVLHKKEREREREREKKYCTRFHMWS